MGGWKLEAFRMALYISFPVLMFHIFNQPQIFEKSVVQTKLERAGKVDVPGMKILQEIKSTLRTKREMEFEAEFNKL